MDWAQVARHYGREFEKAGGRIHLGFDVKTIEVNNLDGSSSPVRIKGSSQVLHFKNLVYNHTVAS